MESDYTLLYLHHGLTSDNKPSLSWLRDAYREFDRKWVGARGVGSRAWGRWLWCQQLCQVLGCPVLGQELIACKGESGAHTWVNAKNLKLERPGLKSQFLYLLTLTFHVNLSEPPFRNR